MIRRIEVIFRRTSVYSGGSAYTSYNKQYRDGQIIWAKDYPRGYRMKDVWNELRTHSIAMFFDIFHPAIIEQTEPPNPPYQSGQSPNSALNRQSRHIQKQVTDYPYLYQWNPDRGKWHMSESGYAKVTAEKGGGMDIAVSEAVSYDIYDDTLIDKFENQLSGQTKSFVLFIFPNKYDDEIRSMLELRITYW